MNLIIEEIKSWSNIQITLIVFEICWGITNIYIVAKLTSIQEKLEKIEKELKGLKDNHISETKGENK